jgi:hypothetical protein
MIKEDRYLHHLMANESLDKVKERVAEKNHDFSGVNSFCIGVLSRRGTIEKLKYFLSFEKADVNYNANDAIFNAIENNSNNNEILSYLLDNSEIKYDTANYYSVVYAWEQKEYKALSILLSHDKILKNITKEWVDLYIKKEDQFQFKNHIKLLNF